MNAFYRGRMTPVRNIATTTGGGDADVAGPAELVGHPARSAMLLALLDGRALPMTTLADEAGVAPSTASAHLARLVDGDLLTVRREGRHRYYELASARVAHALEALAALAPPRPVRSLRAHTRAHALRTARTCYDHIAGRLGVALMRSLLDQGAVTGGDGHHYPGRGQHDHLAATGHDIDYRITSRGWELFTRLGVDVPQGRRTLVRYCVDWTEQQHHLAGAVGAALLAHCASADWVRHDARRTPRALSVTDSGAAAFAEHFGIDVARLNTATAA